MLHSFVLTYLIQVCSSVANSKLDWNHGYSSLLPSIAGIKTTYSFLALFKPKHMENIKQVIHNP